MNTSTVIRAKPVALQVEEILRERIRQGVYPPDQRIPSEEHLAAELQVSRASLRTALASLEAKGYILRRHGDGTYVHSHALEINLNPVRAWDIERQIRESGRTPSLRVLELARRPATPDEAARLGMAGGEEILAVRRLFCADNQPVVVISNYLRTSDLAAPVTPQAASLTPIEFLEQYLLPKPRDGQIHFTATLPDPQLVELLQVQPGQPLLKMDSLVFDADGRPILLEDEIYLGQEGFQMHLGLA